MSYLDVLFHYIASQASILYHIWHNELCQLRKTMVALTELLRDVDPSSFLLLLVRTLKKLLPFEYNLTKEQMLVSSLPRIWQT